MDIETRKYINLLAEHILEDFDVTPPIDNIEKVVELLGGTVQTMHASNGWIDGEIRKNGSDSFVIEISPFQNEHRKKFTIAHELGHLFLHMGYMTNEELWNNQTDAFHREGISEQESQANEFAAAFLMPQKLYKQVLDQNTNGNTVDIVSVAQWFKVSVSATINRGKFLGYLA